MEINVRAENYKPGIRIQGISERFFEILIFILAL